MPAIITGSTGFVGKNLKSYFAISGISFSSLSRKDLTLMNLSWINKEDTVIHLAGKAHDLNKVSSPEQYYEVNFELTKNLYDAFLKSKAKKFIFISSVKAAADSAESTLTEGIIPNPQTHYGKSKLLAEQYIFSQEIPVGKRVYIVRPCMIHGPGNKGNMNLLYQWISKGIPWPLGAFENKRSFLSIENLCFVIRELLVQEEIPSGVYNVADEESLSTNEIIQLIAESKNKKASIWHIPKTLVITLAKLGDKIKLPLNSERLQKLTASYLVDNSKIKLAIGKSLPVSAIDGLKKTILSFSNAK